MSTTNYYYEDGTNALENAPTSVDGSLFTVDITNKFGEDAAWAINDIMRMLSIQFTVQALLFFNDPQCRAFFSAEFVLLTLYVIMGVLFYWLILRRIIQWY